MNDFRDNSYRLGRRPEKQGPRPLLSNWGRIEMKRFKYDVIGISEVRWTGKGETPNGDFIWSGEETLHMRGVGFLMSAQAKKALIGYNPISSRIISMRFDAAPFKISVIHVYAPTSSSSEEDIEAFYNYIDETLAKIDK